MTKLTSLYLALSAQVELIVYARGSRLTVVITGARKRKYDHSYRTVTQDHELWGWRNIIRGIIHYKHRWRWRVVQELTEWCLWPSGAWKQRSDNVHKTVIEYHRTTVCWIRLSIIKVTWWIRRTSLVFVSMHARVLYQRQTQQDGNGRHGAGWRRTMVNSTKQIRMLSVDEQASGFWQ